MLLQPCMQGGTFLSGVQYTTKSPTRSASMSAWKSLSLLPRLSVIQNVFFAMPSSSVFNLHAEGHTQLCRRL